MQTVIIGMGSNLGRREANLLRAVRRLEDDPDVRVLALSPVYRASPMGPALHEFLNAAVAVETDLDPPTLLERLKRIELDAGRPARHERWGPRVLDLDVLLAGDVVRADAPPLVPHPGLASRDFALAPLLDLVPDAVDPVTSRPLAEALQGIVEPTLLGGPQVLPSVIDHEILDHTADVGFEVRGAGFEETLENAVMAVAHAIVDRSELRERRLHEVSLQAPDREALMVDLLSEVVYRLDVSRFVPVRASVRLSGRGGGVAATGMLYGCEVEAAQVRMAVKAATHHRVSVTGDDGGPCTARFYLDL